MGYVVNIQDDQSYTAYIWPSGIVCKIRDESDKKKINGNLVLHNLH